MTINKSPTPKVDEVRKARIISRLRDDRERETEPAPQGPSVKERIIAALKRPGPPQGQGAITRARLTTHRTRGPQASADSPPTLVEDQACRARVEAAPLKIPEAIQGLLARYEEVFTLDITTTEEARVFIGTLSDLEIELTQELEGFLQKLENMLHSETERYLTIRRSLEAAEMRGERERDDAPARSEKILFQSVIDTLPQSIKKSRKALVYVYFKAMALIALYGEVKVAQDKREVGIQRLTGIISEGVEPLSEYFDEVTRAQLALKRAAEVDSSPLSGPGMSEDGKALISEIAYAHHEFKKAIEILFSNDPGMTEGRFSETMTGGELAALSNAGQNVDEWQALMRRGPTSQEVITAMRMVKEKLDEIKEAQFAILE